MNFTFRYGLLGLAALLLSAGCAHESQIMANPTPSPSATASKEEANGLNSKTKHYVVRKGDCLWHIAAKASVLDDPFAWPLLYKANRDQISDPDLIYPDQDLAYSSHYESSALTAAIQMAKERPPYHRHSLPLNLKD